MDYLQSPHQYAHGKLREAVDEMARANRTVQERVGLAALILHTVVVDDLPTQLRPDLAWLKERFTAVDPVAGEGGITSTVIDMSENSAVAVAEKIVELENKLFVEIAY